MMKLESYQSLFYLLEDPYDISQQITFTHFFFSKKHRNHLIGTTLISCQESYKLKCISASFENVPWWFWHPAHPAFYHWFLLCNRKNMGPLFYFGI